MEKKKPILLCILDGWGDRENSADNAIKRASTPCMDSLFANYQHSLLKTSGLAVGLPEGQMGNSEVGHMNIGSGRVVMQDLPRIDDAIKTGQLRESDKINNLIKKLLLSKGSCHIMGLMSDGGVHAHYDHIFALAEIVSSHGIKVKIHAILDGRDTPPNSAVNYLSNFYDKIKNNKLIEIVTAVGRYYAMDRDKRWDRVKIAYDAFVNGQGHKTNDIIWAVKESYSKEKYDEFIEPIILEGYIGIEDGDALIAANFRSDRMREICQVMVDPSFKEFEVKKLGLVDIISMVEYSTNLNKFMQVMFPPIELKEILGEIVANHKMTQLRIAETEKYAHVTFFFNGGREEPFIGEERILIPSPKVATYDMCPQMSAFEVTEKLLLAINSQKFDLIVVNYANADMVGHTGDFQAAVKAIEAVDKCLDKVTKAILNNDGIMLITADHGNAEQMVDAETGIAHTSHTKGPVPLILVGNKTKNYSLKNGSLCDIAPTILKLMNIKKPKAMTGESLIVNKKNKIVDNFFNNKEENPIFSIIIAVLLALVFRSFAFEPFNIPSGSMESTLLIGDYIVVSKYSYGYSRYSFPFAPHIFDGRIFAKEPQRGDIVVFRLPRDPSIDYVKRLIGLPGDKIQMIDGILYINNKAVPKKRIEDFIDYDHDGTSRSIPQYVETLPNGVSYKVLDIKPNGALDNTPAYTVPQGHYMMLGDNRDNSQDSRVMSAVGFIPNENLVGPVRIVLFSSKSSLFKLWDYRLDRYLHDVKYLQKEVAHAK